LIKALHSLTLFKENLKIQTQLIRVYPCKSVAILVGALVHIYDRALGVVKC
jgi:hypothetical protein